MPSRATNGNGPNPIHGSRRPASTLELTRLGGLIMWLPELDGLPTHSELPVLCYDHPVVILSPQASSPTDHVVVLIVTSLGGTDVGDRFRNNRRRRRAYLPIYPAQNQARRIQLHLENGVELRKKSYVNIQKQHTVPFHILRPYTYGHYDMATTRYALTSDSYQKLARHAGYVLPVISPVDDAPTPAILTTTTLPTTLTRDARLHPAPVTYGTILARVSLPPRPPAPLPPPPAQYTPTRPPIAGYYNNTARLHPAPVTYGTNPVSRVSPPSPPLPPLPVRVQGNPARPLIHGYYNTAQTTRQQPPARPRQPDHGLLPRYHSPSPAHYAGASSSSSGAAERDEAKAFAKVVVCVFFGAMVLGLGSVWAHRADNGDGVLGGVSWVRAHAPLVDKGGFGRVVEMGKMGALKVWEWLRGGPGAHV